MPKCPTCYAPFIWQNTDPNNGLIGRYICPNRCSSIESVMKITAPPPAPIPMSVMGVSLTHISDDEITALQAALEARDMDWFTKLVLRHVMVNLMPSETPQTRWPRYETKEMSHEDSH